MPTNMHKIYNIFYLILIFYIIRENFISIKNNADKITSKGIYVHYFRWNEFCPTSIVYTKAKRFSIYFCYLSFLELFHVEYLNYIFMYH
jgi:hypothetical protein